MDGSAVCTCLPSYRGAPPNCRPECSLNSDCLRSLACINQKCQDPCPGACGFHAECFVINHTPICQCAKGLVGDPFINCHQPSPEVTAHANNDPCIPSPCGINAVCSNGDCSCIAEYQGNPFVECRPECILNSDCPTNKACINQKCQNVCPGSCSSTAICEVHQHVAICYCPEGMVGNAFIQCNKLQPLKINQPCQPSPCGQNAQCRILNEQAVCSCLPNYIGAPPTCRPECTSNNECTLNKACLQQKCRDPCPGSCGLNTECSVHNHSPICRCINGFSGNPFISCQPTKSNFVYTYSLFFKETILTLLFSCFST